MYYLIFLHTKNTIPKRPLSYHKLIAKFFSGELAAAILMRVTSVTLIKMAAGRSLWSLPDSQGTGKRCITIIIYSLLLQPFWLKFCVAHHYCLTFNNITLQQVTVVVSFIHLTMLLTKDVQVLEINLKSQVLVRDLHFIFPHPDNLWQYIIIGLKILCHIDHSQGDIL